MLEVCLLGTGGMMPLKYRFLTSLYTEYQGKGFLIDCGEGTQVAMTVHSCKLSRIGHILITHTHADHIAGLPGLLLSVGNSGRTAPVTVSVPESGVKDIEALMSICGELPFGVEISPVSENQPEKFTLDSVSPLLTVSTLPLSHTVPCIGYSAELKRPPVFIPERAKELGVPVEHWKELHAGIPVTLEDGTMVFPEQVTGSQRTPLKLTYTTDTLPIEGIAGFASGSDLFICEGMYGDTGKKVSMNEKRHMLMQDACRLAAEAGSKRLWLTHYSPAMKEPEEYTGELEELFPEVIVSADGERTTLK